MEDRLDLKAQTRRRLAGLLDDLGPTMEAVAERLRAAGVKGLHSSVRHCPVAQYLAQMGVEAPAVLRGEVACSTPDGARRVYVKQPAAVGQFVQRFDATYTLAQHQDPYADLRLRAWDEL